MTPEKRLQRAALSHLATLSPQEAERWLDRHGPPALREPRDAERQLPAALQNLLRRRRQQILAANLHRIERFQALVGTLSEHGIPVCPLKGIHLLDTVYRDDPENRPMVDLDVLVPRQEVDRAVSLLESHLGLRETALSRSLARPTHQHGSHERILVGPAWVVELHTRLGLRTGRAGSWDDLRPSPGVLHERPVHLLDRETTLAYLVAHFVQHGPWSRQVWVADILRWSREGFDPARSLARATALGCRRLVVAGVRALRERLGPEALPGLPDHDTGLGRPLGALYGLLWRSPLPFPRVKRHLSTLFLSDSLRDLVPFFWHRRMHRKSSRSPIRHKNAVSSDS